MSIRAIPAPMLGNPIHPAIPALIEDYSRRVMHLREEHPEWKGSEGWPTTFTGYREYLEARRPYWDELVAKIAELKAKLPKPTPTICLACGEVFQCLAGLRSHTRSKHKGSKP